jgi:hypothetical protein
MMQFRCIPSLSRAACLALAVSALALAAGPVGAQPSCNPEFSLSLTGDSFGDVGSVYAVELILGAGPVDDGTLVTVNNVRFNLDCADPDLGIDCADDTALVSYSGGLADTCASVDFSTTHAGGTAPNQVVFTPNVPLDIPAGTPEFCTITFNVTVEAKDTDGTTGFIEVSGGYRGDGVDAECDNDLSNGATSTAAIRTCPTCDDGLFCNGEEVCDPNTGCTNPPDVVCTDGLFCNGLEICDEGTDECVPGTPVVCSDGAFCNGLELCDEGTDSCTNPPDVVCNDDATCTTDVCDEGIDDCVFTPDDSQCEDGDVCTDDICAPEDPTADAETGCTFPPAEDPPAECVGDFVCRTCGFWGNHPDIVQDLLDDEDIAVCGGPIMETTESDDPTSANEAICVKVQGQQYRQLARQLTCLALNCQFSGGTESPTGDEDNICTGQTTGGQDLGALFAECDLACETDSALVGSCIDRVDCINNGGWPVETSPGHWTCTLGTCSIDGELCGFDAGDCAANTCVEGECTLSENGPVACDTNEDCAAQLCDPFEAENCHERDLCPEGDDTYCYEPPGRAQPGECKASNKTKCTYPDLDCPEDD